MTQIRIIELIVSPKGEAQLTTKGFAGPSCQEASRFLEHALGQTSATRRTAEFFQTESVRRVHSQRS